MKVTAKIVARYTKEGRLKGIATVCLGNEFLITGVRIVDGARGLAVFMPSRKINGESYKDICFPITEPLHRQIKDAVLSAYASAETEGVENAP